MELAVSRLSGTPAWILSFPTRGGVAVLTIQ